MSGARTEMFHEYKPPTRGAKPAGPCGSSTVQGRRAMQMLMWTRTRACNGLTRCNRSRPTAPACSARPLFPPGAKHGKSARSSASVRGHQAGMPDALAGHARHVADDCVVALIGDCCLPAAFVRSPRCIDRKAWRARPGLRVAPSALQPHLQARRRGILRGCFRGLRRLHSRYAFSAIGAAEDLPADQKALLRRSGA